MDITKQVDYWRKSAEHDLDTAEALLKEHRYDWALFIGHLVLEKILKALFVKKHETFPPKTHNLILLFNEIGIKISDKDTDFFEEVNTFNISTRYPDEQLKFYKLCTDEFTRDNFKKIKEKYQWIKKKLM